jgi:hypothetical protein
VTILKAGEFKTSDYRKAIPDHVKIQVVLNELREAAFLGVPCWLLDAEVDATDLRFDHRPPLQDRDYDADAGDFIPPQNDPTHLEVLRSKPRRPSPPRAPTPGTGRTIATCRAPRPSTI